VKPKLNEKAIADKEFKVSFRGYNQVEVDEFLDIIIEDYQTFTETISRLQEENQRLKKQLEEARRQPSLASGATNFDILKRLSNLEKHVFGSKLYE